MKIALFQQQIVDAEREQNLSKVRQAFAEVEADLLVVPETFTQGFGGDMASTAEEAEGKTLRFAREMAREHDAMFVGTWCVRDKGLVFNRLHLVRPDGGYDIYDKRHTFRMSTEYEQITRGTEAHSIEWRGWRIRPAVCYDLRFPTWLRNRGLDYDLLLLPACWPASRRLAWNTLLRARAIENQAYVVGCNRVGEHYAGDTQVIDNMGNTIASAAEGREEVVVATLSKEKLDNYRQKWPFYLDAD